MLLALEALVLAFVVSFLYVRWQRKSRSAVAGLPLPPGPPAWPVVGHLNVMPVSHEWRTYGEWAKIYGDVIQLRIFNKSLVILGSLDAAKALLDHNTSVTSDRPHFTMIYDLMGWDWAVQFMGMGPRFLKYRRVVQSLLLPQSTKAFWPALDHGSRSLLRSLVHDSANIHQHVKDHLGGLMMTVLYGEDEGPTRDKYVELAEEALHGLVEAGNIGKFLVDFVPLLRYVPEWVPGAGFQTQARVWRKQARDMIEIPFADVKKHYDEGTAPASVTKTLLEQQSHGKSNEIDTELVKGAVGVLYVGGADTRRAQVEIDSVVGHNRLPDLSDRASLPYLDCIFSEVLRWNPGVPLGVPHSVMADCELNGYRIPAGSTILYNQWAILHDEDVYPEPFKFIPERWIPTEGKPLPPDPRGASFGFGRRICPGRHFADSLLWTMMVRIIAVFDLRKPLDADGNVIEPSGEYLTGLVTHPAPFACKVTPRSQELASLVE
ncbi:cytochrome P450 [Dentipellis sp. KUC8613]|nr:cytochrome P450 [Dentipellis sp. KUC8613]